MNPDPSSAQEFARGTALNVCPACGAHFACGMNTGASTCWCATLPPVLPVPGAEQAGAHDACLCPDCLKARIAGQPKNA